MKKLLSFAFFFFTAYIAYSQTLSLDDVKKELAPLTEKLISIQSENTKLNSELDELNLRLSLAYKTIDSLKILSHKNSLAITQTSNELGIKIKETDDKNEGKITDVYNSLNKNSLYGIIGVLSAILLSGLLYWFLSKRQQTDNNQLSHIINSTRIELTQESARIDVQLIQVIEKQLKVADIINATEPTIDHTFHKNSANELQRIANYANTLVPESQEAVALQGSLGRLRNYFNSSDYEITDFTGKDYDERIPMRVRVTKFDDSLPFGKEIIAKTWEPQIKYKGLVIQEAKIDKKYNN